MRESENQRKRNRENRLDNQRQTDRQTIRERERDEERQRQREKDKERERPPGRNLCVAAAIGHDRNSSHCLRDRETEESRSLAGCRPAVALGLFGCGMGRSGMARFCKGQCEVQRSEVKVHGSG
eukprot:568506-Rhodomonas_salina.1